MRALPIRRDIADVVCYEARPIVGLDRSRHTESAADLVRDDRLKARGFRVLRIWNHHPTHHTGSVHDAIWHSLEEGYSK